MILVDSYYEAYAVKTQLCVTSDKVRITCVAWGAYYLLFRVNHISETCLVFIDRNYVCVLREFVYIVTVTD